MPNEFYSNPGLRIFLGLGRYNYAADQLRQLLTGHFNPEAQLGAFDDPVAYFGRLR
jgi:hypothetical protein